MRVFITSLSVYCGGHIYVTSIGIENNARKAYFAVESWGVFGSLGVISTFQLNFKLLSGKTSA